MTGLTHENEMFPKIKGGSELGGEWRRSGGKCAEQAGTQENEWINSPPSLRNLLLLLRVFFFSLQKPLDSSQNMPNLWEQIGCINTPKHFPQLLLHIKNIFF